MPCDATPSVILDSDFELGITGNYFPLHFHSRRVSQSAKIPPILLHTSDYKASLPMRPLERKKGEGRGEREGEGEDFLMEEVGSIAKILPFFSSVQYFPHNKMEKDHTDSISKYRFPQNKSLKCTAGKTPLFRKNMLRLVGGPRFNIQG